MDNANFDKRLRKKPLKFSQKIMEKIRTLAKKLRILAKNCRQNAKNSGKNSNSVQKQQRKKKFFVKKSWKNQNLGKKSAENAIFGKRLR